MITAVVVKMGSAPRPSLANGCGSGRRSWVRRGIQNATSSTSKRIAPRSSTASGRNASAAVLRLGLLGVRHHRFERIESTGQPSGQTVGQQVEGGVAFGAVPASDACPARGLARAGAVARQRTSPVRVIRTPRKACIAPRLGPNVSLAGVPRWVSKLHRPWPGGGLPARANSSLVQRGAEATTAAPTTPSADDVDASFGPSAVLRTVWTRHGQVQRTCPPPQ